MIWGMTESTFTQVHVVLSLIGIVSGIIMLNGWRNGRRPAGGWTGLFFLTTIATSVTGFGFPSTHLLPSHKVGILSLVVVAIALLARGVFGLRGAWSGVYVVCAVLTLYLNCFVGVVQAFQKIGALSALAPTQSEPPFVVAQLAVLGLFIAGTVLALKRFPGAA